MGSGRSETALRSKARRTRSGTGPPYQLKISLLEIEPEIWRRLLVPHGVRLDRLHEIFQVAMGWTNSHLHEVRVADTRYGEPDPEYDEADKIYGEYFAFTDGIKKSGHYVGGNALQPTHTATTVRARNGKVSITDGPFVETKEQLGGYYLVDAKDLNDAIQVASRIPSARLGSIEVRPVMEFEQP